MQSERARRGRCPPWTEAAPDARTDAVVGSCCSRGQGVLAAPASGAVRPQVRRSVRAPAGTWGTSTDGTQSRPPHCLRTCVRSFQGSRHRRHACRPSCAEARPDSKSRIRPRYLCERKAALTPRPESAAAQPFPPRPGRRVRRMHVATRRRCLAIAKAVAANFRRRCSSANDISHNCSPSAAQICQSYRSVFAQASIRQKVLGLQIPCRGSCPGHNTARGVPPSKHHQPRQQL